MNRRAIILRRIKQLEQEHEKTKRENEYAWERYGSELSSGEMLQKEKDISTKIENLKKLLELPAPLLKSSPEALKESIRHVKFNISKLKEREKELSKELKEKNQQLRILKEVQKNS